MVLRLFLARNSYRPETLISDFDRVILDHGVRQQLFAHASDLRTSGFLVGSINNEVENLALPNAANPGKSEALQRSFNGLSLWVQHASLEGDNYTRLHIATPRTVIERGADQWSAHYRFQQVCRAA